MQDLIIPFNKQLKQTDLSVDATYAGGPTQDALNPLLGVANRGGFRFLGNAKDNSYKLVVLYSSLKDPDWPDYLDLSTGTFTYYGDNKTFGQTEASSRKGNRLLLQIFEWLHSGKREKIPPFLIFTKGANGRDVIFRGLAAPGAPTIGVTDELVAIWKTRNGRRFQNYRAVFTILNEAKLSREWLNDCLRGDFHSTHAPTSWVSWVKTGQYNRLHSEPTVEYRTKDQQFPSSSEGQNLLQTVYSYFSANPYSFEKFAAELVQKMDSNIETVDLTRPYVDGGRDALGKYRLGLESDPIVVDFALEAKCYSLNNSVGVKETARLISRLRYRQFGILVTTSYVAQQAYKEIREDRHPVIIISGRDIVTILRRNGLGNITDLDYYLKQFPL